MKAADVMVTDVIALRPQDTVQTGATVLLDKRIGAAPVINAEGRLVGIVSGGDLMFRNWHGRRRSWWLQCLVAREALPHSL